MELPSLLAFIIYFGILVTIAVTTKIKNQTSYDFIMGGRKMNFWLTAFSAHASDMSSWIFMGYPAVIYTVGLFNVWTAVGLTVFMFFNWQFIARKLRNSTEIYNSLTLPSFFESRFSDTTGLIRIFTTIISFVFYTIYISAGLVGLGILLNTLFGVSNILGITLGVFIIIPYLFVGGYVTLAWTDLFQGLFLITTIVFVPLYALPEIGGWGGLLEGIHLKTNYKGAFPDHSWKTIFSILFLICGWGLGYFGQPHVITKFMGITDAKEIPKAKWVGISWQIICLSAATLIGLVGIAFFEGPAILRNDQLVFIDLVLNLFPTFISAFILCAIVGATITCMDSQILVLASNLTEDLYKRVLRKGASSKELLVISRLSIFLVALVAYLIACTTSSTVYNIVSYAWYGLGASFGPLVLFALYSKKTNKMGAWAGLLSGSIVSGIWPLVNQSFSMDVPTLIPGFAISSFTIWAISSITQFKSDKDIVGFIK